jgi:hypothetical protein
MTKAVYVYVWPKQFMCMGNARAGLSRQDWPSEPRWGLAKLEQRSILHLASTNNHVVYFAAFHWSPRWASKPSRFLADLRRAEFVVTWGYDVSKGNYHPNDFLVWLVWTTYPRADIGDIQAVYFLLSGFARSLELSGIVGNFQMSFPDVW